MGGNLVIIIELKGGLGNQMFQYALYEKLTTLGKDVKFDITTPKEKDWMFLEKLYGLTLPEAEKTEIRKMRDCSRTFFARVRRKIFGSYHQKLYIDAEERAQLEILDMDDIYLSGYWQSEKYFKDIEDRIREDFKMKPDLSEYQKDILRKIDEYESVSIHVRRGDYLQFPKIYGGICTEDYYNRAIAYFFAESNPIHFFVFSNDYDYAKKHFTGDHFTVVYPGDKSELHTEYTDMFLMSGCKHNIIANSSFSWWAAWLNSNPCQVVVAPPKWLQTINIQDIWCDDWIKLEI